MSIRSMTGFGRAAFDLGTTAYAVEIRSVNHRYLDTKVRMPREFGALEPAVRSAVSKRLTRGRCEIVIQLVGAGTSEAQELAIDHTLARAVHQAHQTLAKSLDIPMDLSTSALVAWPGVVCAVAAKVDDDAAGTALAGGLERALTALVEMRSREGASLAEVVRGHLARIEGLRSAIEARAPQQALSYRDRLENRMREFIEALDIEVDQGRVVHEIAVFSERTDVAEEVARLAAHIEQAGTLIDEPAGEGSGRRLDFLCQEMFREANTIASKVDDVALSAQAIELKAELERLREQVQNVE